LLLGLVLCCVEILARVVEVRQGYAHAVDTEMLAFGTLATFLGAVLGMWLFSRLNDVLRLGAAARSLMRYMGLVTYPLYLLHEGVGGVASSLLQEEGYGQGFALLAGLALSLCASAVVVSALEPWLKPRLTAMAQRTFARLRFLARSGR
jgi:peptidoglycan/LPS O-acetylase OafA/YrhL